METSLNSGAVFFGHCTFPPQGNCKTVSSVGYVCVQCCMVSLWMHLCKHPLLMEQLYPALQFAPKSAGAACQL